MDFKQIKALARDGRAGELAPEDVKWLVDRLAIHEKKNNFYAGDPDEIMNIKDGLDKYFARVSKGKEYMPGIALPAWCASKLAPLYLDGLPLGSIIIVGAPSSTGKSTLAIQSAQEWADAGMRILYITCEEGGDEYFRRVATYRLKKSHNQILMEQDRWLENRNAMPKWCSDDPDRFRVVSNNTVWSRIESQAIELSEAGGGLDVLVVDYLQLISGDNDNRVIDLEKIARKCRNLAGRLKCIAVLVTQVDKNGESKWAKAVYDLSDTFWVIEPIDAEKLKGTDFEVEMKLTVLKNRFGAKAMAKIYWVREHSRFYEISQVKPRYERTYEYE